MNNSNIFLSSFTQFDIKLNIAASLSIIISTAILYWYYKVIYYPHTYGPLSKIPGEGWPLWGLIKFKFSILFGVRPQYVDSLHKKYGKIVLVGAYYISCIDKKDIDKIYSTYQFTKAEEYKTFDIYGGENIFSTRNREFHAIRRRIITPIVANNNLDLMESTVYEIGTQGLLEHIEKKLEKSDVVNVFDSFHRATFDVITKLYFDFNANLLKNLYVPLNAIINIGSFFVSSRRAIPVFGYPGDFVIYIIAEAISIVMSRYMPNPDPKSILGQFLNTKDPETGKTLTKTETIREVLVVIIGGMDTTAITCSWTFWLLLTNPEAFKKAQEEVDRVFPDKDIPLDVATCKSNLPILEAILLESMRLYPVSAMPLIRNPPATGATLSGYEIPPNTNVFMTNYAYHRNPELWSNPDKFDYTRWLIEDNSKLKAQMMVFSQGPRGCPGRALAWTEMFLMTVSMLQHYEMELSPGQEHLGDSPSTYFLTKPKTKSLYIKLKHRA